MDYFCEELFVTCVLPELQQQVSLLVPQKCYGCQVNHPSQIHHDVCLMMGLEEQVNVCFSDALENLNLAQVVNMCKLYFDVHHKQMVDNVTMEWIRNLVFSNQDKIKTLLLVHMKMEHGDDDW